MLTGNWLVIGSLPDAGAAAFFPPRPAGFGLALSLNEVAGQVTGAQSAMYNCGNTGGGGAGRLAATEIGADGSFTLQTPTVGGLAPTITFTVNGVAPQAIGGTWSGTYSANDSNAGCGPQSGSFTAVPIQPVTGTFQGQSTLGATSGGTPVSISIVLQQGTTNSLPTFSSITSQNALSGSITVQGTSCFTSGTLALGDGAVYGGLVEAGFTMNDGSRFLVTGAIDDTAVSKIQLESALVAGGQCDRLFLSGTTVLVRQ
ncbi:MAG TPA: hypothetical protein VGN01_10980 [Acidobacteriaceae bacterium]|jgi:hypothetical protein